VCLCYFTLLLRLSPLGSMIQARWWWMPKKESLVMLMFHDHTLAGHPGIFKTYKLIAQDYWWPQMKKFITQYVKGCATCQQTKSCTTKLRIPVYSITMNANALPFKTITLDLIVDLPPLQDYDSILTITNHDCTKAASHLHPMSPDHQCRRSSITLCQSCVPTLWSTQESHIQ
jgi:hypothetical protein